MQGSHYKVGEKTFDNYWAACLESKKSGHFAEYVIPQWHIDQLLKVDVPHIMEYSAEYWINRKLEYIADSYSTTRLQYSGGTDSHTILCQAKKLGIKFDSLWTCTGGLQGDPYYDEEFVLAFKFLQENPDYVQKHEVFRPKIEDFEFWLDAQSPYVIPRFEFTFRPHTRFISMRGLEPVDKTISGHNKPMLFVNNSKFYWIIEDASDNVGWLPNNINFFEDGIVPELSVHQAYLVKGYIETHHPDHQGFFDMKMTPIDAREAYNAWLGRVPALSKKLASKQFCTTYPVNEMHQRSMQEVIKLGRHDIIDGWNARRIELISEFKDLEWCIDLAPCQDPYNLQETVDVPHRVVRLGAVFEMHQDGLERVVDPSIFSI